MTDAGIQIHVLRRIAGHGSLSTTQLHLHCDHRKIQGAGNTLNHFLAGPWPPKLNRPWFHSRSTVLLQAR